jgi:Na+/melibiose symporter-like transporter
MESIALTIKFVAMVAFEVFAIAVVGAALIAGLYQLARDQVRGIVDQVRGRRAPTPAMARKGQ